MNSTPWTGPSLAIPGPGGLLHLTADSWAVGIGAKIYFRGPGGGQRHQHPPREENQHVILDLVIEPRFEHLVKVDSRFWNISGIKGFLQSGGRQRGGRQPHLHP